MADSSDKPPKRSGETNDIDLEHLLDSTREQNGSNRPVAGASEQSNYFKENRILQQALRPGFQFQDVYEDQNGRRVLGVVWVVDPRSDKALADQMQQVEKTIGRLQDPKSTGEISQKCEALARYVDKLFLAPDGNRKPISESAAAMNQLDRERSGKRVELGHVLSTGTAVCLQKSLLYKALADHLGLPVTLEKGVLSGQNHAYNVARMPGGKDLIYDVQMREFTGLLKSETSAYDRPTATRKEPLIGDGDASRRNLDQLFAPQSTEAKTGETSGQGNGTTNRDSLGKSGAESVLPNLSLTGDVQPTSSSRPARPGGQTSRPEGRANRPTEQAMVASESAQPDNRPWWERKLTAAERAEKPGHILQHKAVEAIKHYLKEHPQVKWNLVESEKYSPMDQAGHDVLLDMGNGKSLVLDMTGAPRNSDRKADRMMVIEVKGNMFKEVTDANGNKTYEFRHNNDAVKLMRQIATESQLLTNAIDTPQNLNEITHSYPDENTTKELALKYIQGLKGMNWREERETMREKVERFFNSLARKPDHPLPAAPSEVNPEHRKRHVDRAEDMTISTEPFESKESSDSTQGNQEIGREITPQELDDMLRKYIEEQRTKGNLEEAKKCEIMREKLSQPEMRERTMQEVKEKIGRAGLRLTEGLGGVASVMMVIDLLRQVLR